MQLLKALLTPLKTILSDIRQSIVGVIVGLISASVLGRIVYLYITARDATIATLTTPTPLWISILLVLVCCVYIYLKFRKMYSCDDPPNDSVTPTTSEYITRYRTIGNFKWKVQIYPSKHFVLDDYPWCTEHDLKFISDGKNKHCPHTGCKNNMSEYDSFRIKESIKSYIEKEIRTNNMSNFTMS